MENNTNKYQGIAHLISILVLPVLIVIGYFVPWLIAKIIIGIVLIILIYFIWTKILND